MSRIIFEDEYVIVVPTFKEVVPHKHAFYHIFFLGDSSKCDEITVTGSGMLHAMASPDECRLFLMIDSTSDLADFLKDNLITEDHPMRIRLSVPLTIEKEDEYLSHDSFKYHIKEGYKEVAHINTVGKKFDRWYDLIWFQKKI